MNRSKPFQTVSELDSLRSGLNLLKEPRIGETATSPPGLTCRGYAILVLRPVIASGGARMYLGIAAYALMQQSLLSVSIRIDFL